MEPYHAERRDWKGRQTVAEIAKFEFRERGQEEDDFSHRTGTRVVRFL